MGISIKKTIVCLLALVQLSFVLSLGHQPDNSESFGEDFDSFVRVFNKQYQNDRERQYRLRVWNHNRVVIEKHNTEAASGKHSYTLGMNQFGDMTLDEFRETMLKYKPRGTATTNQYNYQGIASLPQTVDWKAQGYVTEVGNQGQCGSCWAFTATGALEGQHKKKTGKLVDLSEQNLMDCSEKQGNHGCEGGMMDWSYIYVKQNGGIDTEQSYPYNQSQPGSYKCRYKQSNRGATCTGYVDLPKGNETILNEAVATIGPIACAVDATQQGFMFYKSGVYDDPKCNHAQVDHSLVIIGYGPENGKEFWDCKNSWGTSWGNKGYIKMVRNKNNQCGIATEASYPTV